MATEQMFTSLPTTGAATMSDIICAVQGYVSPSNLGLSVQENLQQIYNLFQSNLILSNPGNPNGVVAGTTYQFCWDTTNSILYSCVVSGTASTTVWIRSAINGGYTTTATAAGTTTLTVTSTYWQFFTGSTTQTLIMPVANTLSEGMTWSIVNNSTGAVTIQSSGLNTIVTLAASEVALVTCILNSGTSAASWNANVSAIGGGVTSITGTAHQVIASASTGAVTLSTPQNIDTTSSPTFAALTLTAPLAANNGGTGIANASGSTITLGGAVTFSGAHTFGATLTANTSVTFPTSGTLATTGTLVNVQVFTSGSSATYTKTAGANNILVEVIGGGGGGGGSAGAVSSFAAAGGGGAAGYARLFISGASSTYIYTVGTGGNGGTAGNNAGSTGGTTSFGASLQATGGTGGAGSPGGSVSVAVFAPGGSPGAGSSGSLNGAGTPGQPGIMVLGNLAGGNGGSSYFGGGAVGIQNNTGAGNAATGFGSGGGGSAATTTNEAGGNGSGGVIFVWEFE